MELKYKTGQYTVRLFDRYGVKERDIDASSHTEGVRIGMTERGSGSEALAKWLADNNASAFGRETATYEQWLGMIKAGWAPSAVADANGMQSGVAAISSP